MLFETTLEFTDKQWEALQALAHREKRGATEFIQTTIADLCDQMDDDYAK